MLKKILFYVVFGDLQEVTYNWNLFRKCVQTDFPQAEENKFDFSLYSRYIFD